MTAPVSSSHAHTQDRVKMVTARILHDRLTTSEAAAVVAVRLVLGERLTLAQIQDICGYRSHASALSLLEALEHVLPQLSHEELPSSGGRPAQAWYLECAGQFS